MNYRFEEPTERFTVPFRNITFAEEATPRLAGAVTSSVPDILAQPHWRPDYKVRQPDLGNTIRKLIRIILILDDCATGSAKDLPHSVTLRTVSASPSLAAILPLGVATFTG